ncbi:MAG: hypothetical protein ACRD20_18210 [Terriglobales bacterium]
METEQAPLSAYEIRAREQTYREAVQKLTDLKESVQHCQGNIQRIHDRSGTAEQLLALSKDTPGLREQRELAERVIAECTKHMAAAKERLANWQGSVKTQEAVVAALDPPKKSADLERVHALVKKLKEIVLPRRGVGEFPEG